MRRHPIKDWDALQRQAGEVLGEEFWQDFAGLIPVRGPRIDMYYTSVSVVVLAEMPGLQSADNIAVYLDGQSLVMEGEIPRLYPVTDKHIPQQERFFGSFRRTLAMPKPVSAKEIQAKYTQGLLIVELPIDRSIQHTAIPIDFA